MNKIRKLTILEAIEHMKNRDEVLFVSNNGQHQFISELSGISKDSSQPFKAKKTNKWYRKALSIFADNDSSLVCNSVKQTEFSFENQKTNNSDFSLLYQQVAYMAVKCSEGRMKKDGKYLKDIDILKVEKTIWRDLLTEVSIAKGKHYVRASHSENLSYPEFIKEYKLVQSAIKEWKKLKEEY